MPKPRNDHMLFGNSQGHCSLLEYLIEAGVDIESKSHTKDGNE